MSPLFAHGGEAALLVVALAYLLYALATIVILAVVGILLVAAGLTASAILLVAFRRKRYLFWLVPLVTVGLHLIAWALIWQPLADSELGKWPALGWPSAVLTIPYVSVPVAALCGLLAAALVAPFQLLFRSRKRAKAAGNEGIEPQDVLAVEEDAEADQVLLPPLPARPGWFARMRQGFTAPWHGFVFLCRHPELWRYGVWPIVLNLLISAFVVTLLLAGVAVFAVYLHPQFPEGWGWLILEIVCGVGLLLLALTAALVVWKVLEGILCGHFYDKLARQVELRLGMNEADMRDVPWLYHVVDSLRDVAALIAVNVGFLFLNVVPVLGSVASLGGSLYFDCWIFGMEYLDFPLALRGLRRAEKKEFARRHRGQTLGLGLAVLFLQFVPVVGAVVLTTAVVGGVLLHRTLRQVSGVTHGAITGVAAISPVHSGRGK